MEGLDALDLAILVGLQREGRIPSSELAQRVGLSASACARRIRRLEESGVIDRYVMLVDREAIGRPVSVWVEISLESQHGDYLDEFEKAVRASPEVMSCHLMAGDGDYLLHVACIDVADYERIHRSHLARLPGVARLRSSFAIREVCARTDFPLQA